MSLYQIFDVFHCCWCCCCCCYYCCYHWCCYVATVDSVTKVTIVNSTFAENGTIFPLNSATGLANFEFTFTNIKSSLQFDKEHCIKFSYENLPTGCCCHCCYWCAIIDVTKVTNVKNTLTENGTIFSIFFSGNSTTGFANSEFTFTATKSQTETNPHSLSSRGSETTRCQCYKPVIFVLRPF